MKIISDEALLAQVFVLVGRVASKTGETDPDEVAREVLKAHGEAGIQALSRVVGAHDCLRMVESGDNRRPRTIIREVNRRQKKHPESVLDDLGVLLEDIRRDKRYGPSSEMIDAVAQLAEFRVP